MARFVITSTPVGKKAPVYVAAEGVHGWTRKLSEARTFLTRTHALQEIARSLSLSKGSAFFGPAQPLELQEEARPVVEIEYPSGGRRALINAGRNYRGRDANGKTYRVSDQTARRMLEEFDDLCNEGSAKLAFIDDAAVRTVRQNCSL